MSLEVSAQIKLECLKMAFELCKREYNLKTDNVIAKFEILTDLVLW